jgi:hypothetical protein
MTIERQRALRRFPIRPAAASDHCAASVRWGDRSRGAPRGAPREGDRERETIAGISRYVIVMAATRAIAAHEVRDCTLERIVRAPAEVLLRRGGSASSERVSLRMRAPCPQAAAAISSAAGR